MLHVVIFELYFVFYQLLINNVIRGEQQPFSIASETINIKRAENEPTSARSPEIQIDRGAP